MRASIPALMLLLCATAYAEPHSDRECSEGGDFIRNAARSRDSGATRDFFVGRLEEDLVTIRAFPPALRWFVHDADDERFLRSEVEAVFDSPVSSEEHRSGFVLRCSVRAARAS